MFSHFALTSIWPTVAHANRQTDTAGRLVSRATKVMIICLAVLWNGQLIAETDDDLSKEYSNCIDKASRGARAEMFECNGEELDRQETRLNDNYKMLMSKLSRNQKKVLLDAQRAWVKFRKTNCESFYQHAGGDDGGWGARFEFSGCFLTMTAARAKELGLLRPYDE